jgi:opacity protein-like surface antigen
MRAKCTLVLLTLALAPAAAAAVGMKATLKAPATDPQIDVRWWYSIKVTDLTGARLRATVTAEVVDTFGYVHPVQFSWSKTKDIVNWPFKGTFRDGIKFPPESRGFALTLRWTLKTKIGGKTYKKVLKRKVTPG